MCDKQWCSLRETIVHHHHHQPAGSAHGPAFIKYTAGTAHSEALTVRGAGYDVDQPLLHSAHGPPFADAVRPGLGVRLRRGPRGRIRRALLSFVNDYPYKI